MADSPVTKEIVESGVKLNVGTKHHSPALATAFYNPKMLVNRELVLCSLATMRDKRPKCLDAFAATGISGLRWLKQFGQAVNVTMCEISPKAVDALQHNCLINDVVPISTSLLPSSAQCSSGHESPVSEGDISSDDKTGSRHERCFLGTTADMDVSESASAGVLFNEERREKLQARVVCCDVSVLMHSETFDFIHLDPFGHATPYLSAALRHSRQGSVLAVTSTDMMALYGNFPGVVARHYGGVRLIRTTYARELAARLVLAAIARAAGVYDKGIRPLLAVSQDHFVLVIVEVQHGSQQADQMIAQVQRLMHCRLCGERAFAPTVCVLGSAEKAIPCKCAEENQCATSTELGPVWCGKLFDLKMIELMMSEAAVLAVSKRTRSLLESLCSEAAIMESVADSSQVDIARSCCNSAAFYYNVHGLSAKGQDLPNVPTLMAELHRHSHTAVRTHFCTHSLRTTATQEQLRAIIHSQSTPTARV